MTFSCSPAEIIILWTPFGVDRNDKKKFATHPKHQTENRLPEVLRGLEKTHKCIAVERDYFESNIIDL